MGDCEDDFIEVSLGEDLLLFVASSLISLPNLPRASPFSKCSSSTPFSMPLGLLDRLCSVMAVVRLGKGRDVERSVEDEVVLR